MTERDGLTVLANWPADGEDVALVRRFWPSSCIPIFGAKTSEAELEARAGEFDVIVGSLPPALMRRANRLKFVHVMGHGIDRLDQGEVGSLLRERGIPVARANPAASTIAEYVIMCLIALNRRLIAVHEALAHRGDWSLWRRPDRLRESMGGELQGSSLCIVGLGSIGQAIALRARAFGMHVGALTRTPERYDAQSFGLDYIGSLADPDPYIARARHLVIVVPLSQETENLIDARRLAAMPNGGFLVNVGRSAIVHSSALYDALRTGHLAGAAIDVWENEHERSYPARLPLHHFNTIMTPHYAAITRETRIRAIEAVGNNLSRWLAGQRLLNATDIDGHSIVVRRV